jgi:hypothetical protein
MTLDGGERIDDMQADLGRLLQSSGIKLGQVQRRRLHWLVERFGGPVMQRGAEGCTGDGAVVIVAEPPSGAGAELFCRALPEGCVVVIPFGENPAFDFLKSKLTEFGTIGPSGADGPHELWWGGTSWSIPWRYGTCSAPPPRVISCYPRGFDEGPARHLKQALERLQLDFNIEPIIPGHGFEIRCAEKVEFILRMWRRYRQPLLFVDAGAVLQEAPLLPASLDCDVALHKWNRWEMSARTIYLAPSSATEALLQTWHQLATLYPTVWDGYLLDQAWSLTSSQTALDTVWLPRSYHALRGELRARDATIIHNLPATTLDLGPDPDFAAQQRVARRASRAGAREPLIVIRSPASTGEGIAVILRDVEASNARAVATSIETLTSAFADDCGGFGQLELSLCLQQDDVSVAREAAKMAKCRFLEIAAGAKIPADLFGSLARYEDAGGRIVAMKAHGGQQNIQ